MSRLREFPSAFTALLLLAGCDAAPGEAPESAFDVEAARTEVLAAEDAMNLAVDGVDCEGGLELARDIEPLFVGMGTVFRTKAELMEMCTAMVSNRTGAVFDIEHRTAHVLAEDAAMVVREGDYTINLTDGSSNEVYLVMTTVWTREDDGWKMIHLHESIRQPPPPGDGSGP